jgi:hypothetical protein
MLEGIPNKMERAITMIGRLDPTVLRYVDGTAVVGAGGIAGFAPWYATQLCDFLICDQAATDQLRRDNLPLKLVKAHSTLDARLFAAWFAWYARSLSLAPRDTYKVLVRVRQRVLLEPVSEYSLHHGWILREGCAAGNRRESLTISDDGIAGLDTDAFNIPDPSKRITVNIAGLAMAAKILLGARN